MKGKQLKKYKIIKSPVKKVEKLEDFKDEYVYDIVMSNKDRQWFFGNNMLAHNSTYFKTFANNIDDAVIIGDHIGKLVNESFPQFMRDTFFCEEGYDNIIETDREIIGSSGIFIAKKLYTIRVIDNEGKKCDKLKSMGITLKKSTLPKEFQKSLSAYVKRILLKEDWNDIAKDIVDYKIELSQIDEILRIGKPTGVNNLQKYTQDYQDELQASIDRENQWETGKEFKTKESRDGKGLSGELFKARLPGHVLASLHWNKCLKQYRDYESIEIVSGTKIKVYKLKTEFYNRFNSIAIPTDTTIIPDWFIENYKNSIDIDLQLEKLIDDSLKNIFEAIGKVVPCAQDFKIKEFIDIDTSELTFKKKRRKEKRVESSEQNDLVNSLISF